VPPYYAAVCIENAAMFTGKWFHTKYLYAKSKKNPNKYSCFRRNSDKNHYCEKPSI